MHPADIRAALRKAGHTGWSIAQHVRHGDGSPVTEQAVSNVIHGRSRSDAIAVAIAGAIGCSTSDLWPATYPTQPSGSSKPHYRLRLNGSRELVSLGRSV